MGKLSTAARAARGTTKTKRTSRTKIANKSRQRTPKAIRKQINRTRLNREEEIKQITNRAAKKVQQLSFNNLTKSIKNQLSSKPKPIKHKLSRSEKNKSFRLNKRLKKLQHKQDLQNAKFDFTTYDRNIDSESSEEDENDQDILLNDNEQKQEQLLQQFEQSHKPKSYDLKKVKLSVQSATGEWIRHNDDNVQDDSKNDNDNDNDGDVVIHEQEIADYMNLNNVFNNDNSDGDVGMDSDDEIERKLTVGEWKLEKKGRLNKVKLEIADMGESVLEDPYKNCGLLQVMYGLCQDDDVQVSQLAMLSITKIIIDIMPPYKIGTINQDIAVKKRNEKVREFEKSLLNSYQLFLKYIFKSARIYHSNVRNKTKKQDPKRFILGRCAIKCICLFLRKCSHFNYTKELIKNAIPLTNCKIEQIRGDACSAIVTLLRKKPINNATVECVQLLTQRIEKKNFNVHPDQINVLQYLPLEYLQPPDKEEEKEQKPTRSRWEKEMDKKMKKDAKELSAFDNKKMYKRQQVIIEQIFGVYFYVLKLEVSSKLLEPALRGMSKFAHLINVELILDLIQVISEKLENEKNTLSLACKIMCIQATFKCLSNRGTSITMDVKQHYVTIYEMLLSVSLNYYEWNNFYLIFECLNSMFGFHASKTLPIERIASFVKRLLNISTQLPSHFAIGCQHMARKLMLSDPRLYNMLDYEGGYDREYHSFESNPDHTNALACCLWELTLTSNHWHPFMKTYSRDLASWSEIPLKLSTCGVDKVIRKYDTSGNGNFRPWVNESKLQKYSMIKHPAKELNNIQCMKDMVDWFGFDVRRYKKEVRNMKMGIDAKKGIDKVIDNYVECSDLLWKNEMLKELNQEYELLNQVLLTD